jgi:hypothetical protein
LIKQHLKECGTNFHHRMPTPQLIIEAEEELILEGNKALIKAYELLKTKLQNTIRQCLTLRNMAIQCDRNAQFVNEHHKRILYGMGDYALKFIPANPRCEMIRLVAGENVINYGTEEIYKKFYSFALTLKNVIEAVKSEKSKLFEDFYSSLENKKQFTDQIDCIHTLRECLRLVLQDVPVHSDFFEKHQTPEGEIAFNLLGREEYKIFANLILRNYESIINYSNLIAFTTSSEDHSTHTLKNEAEFDLFHGKGAYLKL